MLRRFVDKIRCEAPQRRFVDSRDVANDCPDVTEVSTDTLELDQNNWQASRKLRSDPCKYVRYGHKTAQKCVGEQHIGESQVQRTVNFAYCSGGLRTKARNIDKT